VFRHTANRKPTSKTGPKSKNASNMLALRDGTLYYLKNMVREEPLFVKQKIEQYFRLRIKGSAMGTY
jgi:hypothetical protein